MEYISQPWPWWFAGIMIGITVPLLLLLGNKNFGISSSFRHICALGDSKTPYFKYDWQREIWNLFLVGGIFIGGFVSYFFLQNQEPMELNPTLVEELKSYHIEVGNGFAPAELFGWKALFSVKGFLLSVVGGFLVGFGTRYAGGCTSGHSIMGLSNLQWPSLVATVSFFVGGILMTNFILPIFLKM